MFSLKNGLKFLGGAVITTSVLLMVGCSNPTITENVNSPITEEIAAGSLPAGLSKQGRAGLDLKTSQKIAANKTVTFKMKCPKTFKSTDLAWDGSWYIVTYKAESAKFEIHERDVPISIISQTVKIGGDCTVTVKASRDFKMSPSTMCLAVFGTPASWKKDKQ